MNTQFARLAILVAVILQSLGKVTYGSYLSDFPAPAFVFVSFTLATVIFSLAPNRRVGVIAWPILIMLNLATACTFISIFIALKVIGPATVGAIEIGVGPIFAACFAGFLMAERVNGSRIFVCGGILIGCFTLGYAAFDASVHDSTTSAVKFALLLSILAGAGAVTISFASKSLMSQGWNQSAVLTHRAYAIIPASLALWYFGDHSPINWDMALALQVVLVGFISITLPLYLLLIGLKHCDVYTVMVTMAAQPLVTFSFEYLSPIYDPSTLTAVGIAIVTSFVFLDVLLNVERRKKSSIATKD